MVDRLMREGSEQFTLIKQSRNPGCHHALHLSERFFQQLFRGLFWVLAFCVVPSGLVFFFLYLRERAEMSKASARISSHGESFGEAIGTLVEKV